MDTLAEILSVRGTIPRRAALTGDGALVDRATRRDLPEVELLSRVCEVVRRATGKPPPPRRSDELLELALATNSPEAWAAAKDDVATGDFEAGVAAKFVGCRGAAAASMLVSCLAEAGSREHMLHVCVVTHRLLPAAGQEVRLHWGAALSCQLRGVVDALVRHHEFCKRDVRDAIFDGFAEMLAVAEIPDARAAEFVRRALESGRDDVLRLFARLPATFLAADPGLLAALVARAGAVPEHSAYPVLALLARAPRDALVDHAAAIVAALRRLEKNVDVRTYVAAASVAEAVAPAVSRGDAALLATLLAKSLRTCAGSLVASVASRGSK